MYTPCSQSVLVLGLFQKDNDLLIPLVRANHRKGSQWRLPGGGVKVREEPEMAARRELQEEVGLHLESSFPIAKIIKTRRSNRFKEHCQHFFAGEIISLDTFSDHAVDGEEFLTNTLFSRKDVEDACFNNLPLAGYEILPAHKLLLVSALKKIFD